MSDALRALIGAVGLVVGSGAEIRSDDDRWTMDLHTTGTHVWVATLHTAIWSHRGDGATALEAGGAALVERHRMLSIGTDADRSGPPQVAPQYEFPHEALFSSTGVHTGTATLGPLADEALALPSLATTQPPGAPAPDVVLALRHIGHLDGGRWHGAQQDALARLVVTTVLRDNPPPMLGDNSVARVLDRLFDGAVRHTTVELLDGVRMSERTFERRCAATTGRTPAQLGRWFRSLAVRTALADGAAPAQVAQRFGFSTTASMRRALRRVVPPETHVLRRF